MKGRIRQNRVIAPLLRVRDWVMEKTGLFMLKAKIKHRLFMKRLQREDDERKRQVARSIYELPTGLIDKHIEDGEMVVSVTSYGKRVTDMLPYMLYSIVTQTKIPHKIAVYLDNEHWNDEVLPSLLKEMQRIGVDFYYCEDLRSYKKLIPALDMFPDNPIVTFDDDFYYHPEYMEWMEDAYKRSDTKTVIGSWWCIPEKKEGKYIPYNEWKDCREGDKNSPMSFYCGHGTLFPPHVFDDEIKNKDVFMKLCPTADDIWFWVMMERLKVKKKGLQHRGYGMHRLVERYEDYDMENADNLTTINVMQGRNNQQLKALLSYYDIE